MTLEIAKKVCVAVTVVLGAAGASAQETTAPKHSGVFYSTLLANEGPNKRLSGFGLDADFFFLKDVNGDGMDDAVIVENGAWFGAFSDGERFTEPVSLLADAALDSEGKTALMGDLNGDGKTDAVLFDPQDGNWYVSLSEGDGFSPPVTWAVGNGVGSTKQFLADVNGDGKDDAIIYFHTGLVGAWYVGLSDGKGAIGGFSPWINAFGHTADGHLLADVNGDGRADAVVVEKSTGNWSVALSSGTGFVTQGVWKSGFGNDATDWFAYDIDGDGKADVAYYINGNWWVSYATGSGFTDANHHWIAGHRPATMVSRGNKPAPKARMIGMISPGEVVATAVSADEWLCLGNPDKSKTRSAPEYNTWDAWGNVYTPTLGRYDAGDPAVLDEQIRLIHDAGFTYIMLDITNGNHPWVDNRAKKLIERIEFWNANRSSAQHQLYFCIAMGSSRGLDDAAAVVRCEDESRRTWQEFYEPHKDAYYHQDGMPFMVHFVEFLPNRANILDNVQSMPFFQKFTVRWMFNRVADEAAYSNTYGWPLLIEGANPVGDEVMAVSPGFWNGVGNLVDVTRKNGDFYRSFWVRVLKYNPASVWVNSFNESWEHTSVEPARLDAGAAAEHPDILQVWTDYHGQPMDDFYWVMTKQYNRLFMYQELYDGSYLQEEDSETIYVVRRDTLVDHGSGLPSMAPVILVPKGFLANFEGNVINGDQVVVGKIERQVIENPAATGNGATNILTPNNDGINDVWLVDDIDQFPNNHVQVVDKRGGIVFEKRGYRNEWQGRRWGGNNHGELLPEGTYYYQVDYGDAAKKPLKGYITVLHDVKRGR
ncbi:gliding motility-associated C-terminal domain-containing protein [Parapedobacter pyrenivorans]|uniref:T9SS type B sorting domain-containing protein n=1 Tax=Parapedobacter pyrenivorans TaxID=1305674 RepID=UPI00333FD866